MRLTTVMRRLVGVMSMFVMTVRWENGGLVLAVRPHWLRPRCGECGKRRPGYDRQPAPRRWRALSYGSVVVHLEYRLRRVTCAPCGGVRVEAVPWAVHGSWFTTAFEELVAYHAQVMDKTAVKRLLGVSWEAVGNIIERVVARNLDENRLRGVTRIGIDEFSYRKRHRYITVVVDHATKRVIWAAKGRGAETLGAFFDALGPDGVAALELVTLDMAGGYLKALRDRAPHVELVFDRFHVAQLASRAVDDVRRALWREVKGTAAGKALKGTRYALLKSPWNLSRADHEKLAAVQRHNEPLYRAYLLKESLAEALDHRRPSRARRALEEWLAWASRSQLAPFIKLARTIRLHKEGILAYVTHRMTNAVVEGINNKMRTVARRAYGFHPASALISMFFLCAGGIQLRPPLPSPT